MRNIRSMIAMGMRGRSTGFEKSSFFGFRLDLVIVG